MLCFELPASKLVSSSRMDFTKLHGTGNDFIRYHGKFMIVDRTTLLVLGFNYTLLDITKSRSFGIVTKNQKTVQDAIRLFEADCARHPYVAAGSLLVVSY